MQHTSGKNMIETISSSFSTNTITKPPSQGTMSPAKKAPKIACTPITSIKNAEPNRTIMVAVMKKSKGLLSIDPVVRANHCMTILTGKRRNNIHPMQVRRM